MNLPRAILTGFRAYFWLLVGGGLLVALWAINSYVIEVESGDIGWVAFAGFGAVLAVFLFAIRRLSG